MYQAVCMVACVLGVEGKLVAGMDDDQLMPHMQSNGARACDGRSLIVSQTTCTREKKSCHAPGPDWLGCRERMHVQSLPTLPEAAGDPNQASIGSARPR